MRKKLIFVKLFNTFFPSFSFTLKRSKPFGFVALFGDKAARHRSKIWESDSHYKPEFYAELDAAAVLLLNELESTFSKSDKILDICCNAGRHINYLTKQGYKDIHGFDIMKPALEAMPKFFPLINTSTIQHGNAIDIIPSYLDSSFDWAYTHSATIELIPPSFRIHRELSRIVKKGMILLLNENGHYYPRFYSYLFEHSSFRLYKRLEIGGALSICTWIKSDYYDEFMTNEIHRVSPLPER